MNLVIVESPTKARTLGKFLGSEYKIEASYGHVRDLPKSKLGVDTDHDFEVTYVQTAKQKLRTGEIKKLEKGAKKIYLATDPDREGEAIAWHVARLLNTKSEKLTTKQTLNTKYKRVTFHEITKTAIEHALANPGEINMPLVHAQQARRVLDRLVGYKLSPLLWKKVRRGLSAGRVQSVAVRLVVEKEREREAHKSQEYWNIYVDLKPQSSNPKSQFKVQLINDTKNQTEAEGIEKALGDAKYVVEGVEQRDFKRMPPAPFTTSTLQQTAANRLGWSAKKTMQVAQSLYEQGHITYHRTDSTNIADEALARCTEFIARSYGSEYALATPRIFKTKSKVAQEAHEAIRPTDTSVQSLASSHDEKKLYELVWKRFVASQMAEVVGESTTINVVAKTQSDRVTKYNLIAKGEVIKFDGWRKLHPEKEEVEILPEVKVGEELKFVDLTKEQKFTLPPARFNDASIIKILEEMGIGRPSTYAPTLATIMDRRYVEKEEKRYKPTSIGIAVTDFLMTNFGGILDYQFTARMEDDLDVIANGDKKWVPVLKEFFGPFEKKLKKVEDTAERVKVAVENTGEPCPKCNEGEQVIRLGKFGKFLSCSRFPDCDWKDKYEIKTGLKCPKCTEGDVIEKKSKKGRKFYGCSKYPACDFASWELPSVEVK